MRSHSSWTVLGSVIFATVLLGGTAHAYTQGTWLNVGLPTDRDGHSAVYDAARDRMILFGGMAGTRRNDVWVLPTSGAASWYQMWVEGTPPSPRDGHTTVFDTLNDRIIVFGGFDTADVNDVWELLPGGVHRWDQILPAGAPPAPRSGHAAVYDPVRQRMIVIGGVQGGAYLGDVWVLSLAGPPVWNLLAVQGSAPHPRAYHSAIYDPHGDRVLVFGGHDAVTGATRDVWVLSLAGTPTWSLMAPSGPPPPARLQHGAIHDPTRQRMLVFGGQRGDSFDDVWELTLGATPTWSILFPLGSAYPPRHAHSMVYDSAHDRAIVFGGTVQEDVEFKTNEVLSLTLDPLTWTRPINEARPFPREGHSAVIDLPRDRMIVFGGTTSFGAPFNDAWALDLEQEQGWTLLAPAGTPPAGRFDHAAIYDPVGQRMIVFGGRNAGGTAFGGVSQLALSGSPAWSTLAVSGTPPAPRSGHTAVYDETRHRMIVFGGTSGGTVFGDVWALSLGASPAWTLLSPSGAPPGPRHMHLGVYDAPRDRMVVVRGAGSGGASFDDAWELAFAGSAAWNPLAATGSPPLARQRQSAIYDSDLERMIVFGGSYVDGGLQRVDTSHALDLAGPPVWSEVPTGGEPPPAIDGHTAVYDAPRGGMVVFGGRSQIGGLNDGVRVLNFALRTGVPELARRPVGVEVRVHPVPSRGGVTFEIRAPGVSGGTVLVTDVAGRVVRRLAADEGSVLRWDGRTATGARAAAGVYFYAVRCAAGEASGRVVRVD